MMLRTPKQKNILDEICARRAADRDLLGPTFGVQIPSSRTRPVVPFLSQKGSILEIKRSSPSKGIITAELNAAETAEHYASSGARAISVLTERNYFTGSLTDLIDAAAALDKYNAAHPDKTPVAVLRKDFLSSVEEIDVSFRAGADAVLLIARILPLDTLLELTKRCAELSIAAFIEVRLAEDIKKFAEAARLFPGTVVAGVNARNLADFSVDSLVPAGMLHALRDEISHLPSPDTLSQKQTTQPAQKPLTAETLRVVYESGVLTTQAAGMVGHLGFFGMLLGEGAVRNPGNAEKLAASFTCNSESRNGTFWVNYGAELVRRTNSASSSYRPFIKICGITNIDDAVQAATLGADFIGFIFSKNSKRAVESSFVRKVYKAIQHTELHGWKKPQLVGVITDPLSPEAHDAFSLIKLGILDVIQFHGCTMPPPADFTYRDIPRYAAVKIGSENDIPSLQTEIADGEPRVLIDAKVEGQDGGTGVNIDSALVKKISGCTKLWLAGGVSEQNMSSFITQYRPELIDVASRTEDTSPGARPGKKDSVKMNTLFEAFNDAVSKLQ